MHKLLAVLLFLPFLAVNEAIAQQAGSAETELDRAADNLNIIPAAVRLGLQRNSAKKLDQQLKNATKGEVSDLVKNINIYEQRAAKNEGRAPKRAVHIDPDNKTAVRKLLQKDLNIDPYPRLYE